MKKLSGIGELLAKSKFFFSKIATFKQNQKIWAKSGHLAGIGEGWAILENWTCWEKLDEIGNC